jgi:PIN domain-containing protein
MRSNFVLIDFENVQPDSLQLLAAEHFRVRLFIGANQAKLPFETVAAMQKLGERAEYVKVAGNGSNALDFHIAYYIGMHSAVEPSAYFHIVSKDAGFDPLIHHLKGKKVLIDRVTAIREIPIVKAAACKSPEERLQIVVDKLAQSKATKPRTLKTLSSSIASLFQKQLSDDEVAAVVEGLGKQGIISVAGTKITYAATSDV